jgi:signal transduction histidine kinase
MNAQAQQELFATRQALQETRELLRAARALAAERQALLEQEHAARACAERVNALKDEFLAAVSHELRAPLTAIAGWVHLLRHGPSAQDLDKGLDVIEQSVGVQTKLIEDLLDISRITAGRLRLELQALEPRSFIDAAVEAMRPAADQKGIRIRKVLELSSGPVAGDPARLQQVMVNLLANAVKFTPEHGCIEVALQRSGDAAEVQVTDTGIGIPPAFLPHVFDRFRQADPSVHQRYGGLGLGLAIVKHLVDLHGGSITANSRGEGCGATFVLRLPLLAARRDLAPRTAQALSDAPRAAPVESAAHQGV